jgi:hypothetical protein
MKKIRPKILFLQNSHYGGTSFLIKWSKDMEIKTGEFQHGLIIKTHLAYNFGSAVLASTEYKKYLPDYLLTYGEFWSESINTPVKKINIGNPHLSLKLEESKRHQRHDTLKKILVVSEVSIGSPLIKFTKDLASRLPKDEYRIIFRLHPNEIKFEETYKDLTTFENVELSKSGDIYDHIFESDYIVGTTSTALFEAYACNKNVCIYDTTLSRSIIPTDFGIWFKDIDELYDIVTGKKLIRHEKQMNYYLADNWKKTYHTFIDSAVFSKRK